MLTINEKEELIFNGKVIANHVHKRLEGNYCSFCAKPENEVKFLVQGPMVCICDECIELCNHLAEARKDKEPKDSENLDA